MNGQTSEAKASGQWIFKGCLKTRTQGSHFSVRIPFYSSKYVPSRNVTQKNLHQLLFIIKFQKPFTKWFLKKSQKTLQPWLM